jgi:hypothetical protein
MAQSFEPDDVAKLLEELQAALPHESCWTCDCMQAFLTQLEIDVGGKASELLQPLKAPRESMHG